MGLLSYIATVLSVVGRALRFGTGGFTMFDKSGYSARRAGVEIATGNVVGSGVVIDVVPVIAGTWGIFSNRLGLSIGGGSPVIP